MNERKIMDNREYYSIKRASELLECTVDDIEHFLSTAAVGGYVRLYVCEAQCDILVGVGEKERIMKSAVPEKLINDIVGTELSFISEIEMIENENDMLLTINAIIGGTWALDYQTTMQLLHGDEIMGARMKPSKIDGSAMKLNDSLPSVYGFSAPAGLKASDIHILRHDVIRLYESLHRDAGPLPNIHNSKDIRQNVMEAETKPKRATRTEYGQVDAFMKLLGTIPELEKDMFNNISKAEIIFDDFLIKNGQEPARLGENTIRNWKKYLAKRDAKNKN